MSTEQQSSEPLEEEREPVKSTAVEEEATNVEEEATDAEAEAADDEKENGADDRSEMDQLYAETLRNIEEGEIVKGTVVKVTDQEVLVDVGYKSEGSISLREFRNERGEAPVAVGDEVEVFLEEAENSDGHIVLSKEKADKAKVWDEITKVYEDDSEIEGTVTDKIKGGLAVDIGVRGFLPGSQVDLRPVRDLGSFVGQKITMKILKLNRQRGNIVLSRRAVLEKGREEKRRETLSSLKVDMRIKGIVKNITEYGAFIDLGGVDGLLHITDMSWGRVSHPTELLSVGEETEVVVLKFDPETERVSLGLKQKTPDPWTSIREKYPPGTRAHGKVVSLTDYGAFVELEEGIEGLVHVSEMSWTRRIKHPSKILAVGDIIEAMILDVNPESKRISLGLKQIQPNPWDVIEEKYPPDSIIEGKVRNLTDFGAFIGLEEGIDGLVHISDLSWTQKVNHPSDILKKGDIVKAKVLNIDKSRERLSLGIKQVNSDPWQEFTHKYGVGKTVTGTIVKVTDFGLFLALEGDLEGLIHSSELGIDRSDQPERHFTVGQELTAKILKVDTGERKISLSLSALQNDEERKDISSYLNRKDTGVARLGDMLPDRQLGSGSILDGTSKEEETEE
jgi:small subunit ribosomal protein S1